MIKNLLRAFALLLLVFAGASHAQSIVVNKALARATVGKASNGAAFLQIENKGADDVLLSGSSPASSKVEIHTMSMKPGSGVHIMLMGLKKPLAAGDKFPLTLNFRKAGKIDTTVEVSDMGMPMKKGDGDMHDHEHHRHDH
jgi:copper(I)-binding protein